MLVLQPPLSKVWGFYPICHVGISLGSRFCNVLLSAFKLNSTPLGQMCQNWLLCLCYLFFIWAAFVSSAHQVPTIFHGLMNQRCREMVTNLGTRIMQGWASFIISHCWQYLVNLCYCRTGLFFFMDVVLDEVYVLFDQDSAHLWHEQMACEARC